MTPGMRTVYTCGHSSHPIETFLATLEQHGVAALVDVRSAPYSRFNPFRTGLTNLLGCYRDIADSWQVYDNFDFEGPRLIASRGAGKAPAIADPGAWGNLKEPR